MNKFPLLQSGFISFTTVGLERPKFEDATFEQVILGKTVKDPMQEYHYSRTVYDLITEWNHDAKVVTLFEFRERVLQAAVQAFGTKSLRAWVELQDLQPTLGQLHLEFLGDTLAYVLQGAPRSVETLQWTNLLLPESGRALRFNVEQWKIEPQVETTTLYGPAFDLLPFLHRWVARKDGAIDLLKTLHVIFGRRFVAAR